MKARAFATATATGLIVALVVAGGTQRASAIDHSKGYPGFCRDANGVTVVIDFQQLGGITIVRCDPRRSRGTGLDALIGAGIQIEGVQRWGLSFVCRIENRPSAVETIPIAGTSGYRERCIDTPPAGGYWSYWQAGNNCPWKYSQWGVKNRDFTPGGFEGWSFSLNATADDNPTPRIAPVRPGTAGGACTTPEEPGPEADDPNEQLDPVRPPHPRATIRRPSDVPSTAADRTWADRSGTADVDAEPAQGSSEPFRPVGTPGRSSERAESPASTNGTVPAGEAAQAGADPEANVRYTGGAGAEDVRDVVQREAHASPVAPWVALGVIILLAGIAGLTEGRRRRRRT